MLIRLTLMLFFLLNIVLYSSAQKIDAEKIGLMYRFSQDGARLKMGDLSNKIAGNLVAEKLMRAAKRRKAIGIVVTVIGGTFTGLTLSAAVSSIYFPIDIPIMFGVIFTGITLPVFVRANRKAFQAIQVHNHALKHQTKSSFKPQIEFAASSNGLGFVVRF